MKLLNIKYFCKKGNGNIIEKCFKLYDFGIPEYIRILRTQLLRCNDIRQENIFNEFSAPSGIQIFLPERIHPDAKPVPINLWQYAFEKELFVEASDARIHYFAPDTEKTEFVGKTPNNIGYASILRHPISGIYMMYYGCRDIRTKNEQQNGEIGTPMNKMFYSEDGKVFKPLRASIIGEAETNIILYNDKASIQFSPMVDFSDCTLENGDFHDNGGWNYADATEADTQDYLGIADAQSKFPPRKQYSFKAIGGEQRPGSNDMGIMTLRSADGVFWRRDADPYANTPILTDRNLLDTNFTRVYFDNRGDLLYDHDERRYKLFTRHNTKRGKRTFQLLVSNSNCEWQRWGKMYTRDLSQLTSFLRAYIMLVHPYFQVPVTFLSFQRHCLIIIQIAPHF